MTMYFPRFFSLQLEVPQMFWNCFPMISLFQLLAPPGHFPPRVLSLLTRAYSALGQGVDFWTLGGHEVLCKTIETIGNMVI